MKAKITSSFIGIILTILVSGWIIEPIIVSASAGGNDSQGGFRGVVLQVVGSIDNWLRGLIYYKEIQEENNTLVFQNRALRSLLIDYSNLKAENDLLRKALNIHKSEGVNFILANVIGRSPLNFSQTFVIDVGEEDGVRLGQAVVWGGKTLVGEIIDVRKNASTVRAITDSEFKAAVFIGEHRIEALLRGNGFLPPLLDLVPREEEVSLNEQVYTSGLDNKFIRGLYIGDVSEVNKPEGKVFQQIKMTPALDWTTLYQVLVITN